MNLVSNGIEKLEKLLEFILVSVAKKVLDNCGILYLLYIDNVLFAIQISRNLVNTVSSFVFCFQGSLIFAFSEAISCAASCKSAFCSIFIASKR